ncbi:hypothetical protein COLO4_25856 [Corchorus olitorius]|uniref:F-box domain-containing protein n=1 Tax=Corchorus olitorius TaxID=93759 RepID=A0A1R3HZP3_9ROSI|nr:hypothetical protein COLO4_25856 [Corchorus olitorius]
MEKSKVRKTEQIPTAANMMDRLPRDIVIRILSRIPLTYLIQLKLVCRAWRSLIQDPLLASDHFSNMANNDPSLIIQSHLPDRYQLFFTDLSHDSQGNLISKKPPCPVEQMFLKDSCNGLLCMRDARDRALYICNPFTRQSIELPKVNSPAQLGPLEFGFHPTTKEYKLVHIGKKYCPSNTNQSIVEQHSEVHVLTIGSLTWRNLGTIPHRFIRKASKVIINGRLHWISKPKKRYSLPSLLISFDLETEQFQEVPKPDCCGSGSGIYKCFHRLMILSGCLSISAYQNGQLGIWVMKEYGVKESWIKEFNIEASLPRVLRKPMLRGRFVVNPYPFVRVICSLKSGEILLEYGSRTLVLYDPQLETYKKLTFPEMPTWFKIIVHVGSLNWLDTPLNM